MGRRYVTYKMPLVSFSGHVVHQADAVFIAVASSETPTARLYADLSASLYEPLRAREFYMNATPPQASVFLSPNS